MIGRFLPGVPGPEIEAIFDVVAGNEIATGKFDSPESSAALAANAFGFFLQRASELPGPSAVSYSGLYVISAKKISIWSTVSNSIVTLRSRWTQCHPTTVSAAHAQH